jgi:hypothetical protein
MMLVKPSGVWQTVHSLNARVNSNVKNGVVALSKLEGEWQVVWGSFFGNGSDGVITLDSSHTERDGVGWNGSVFYLTRDVNASSLTVVNGETLDTRGYIIRVTGDFANYGSVTDTTGPVGGLGGVGGIGCDSWAYHSTVITNQGPPNVQTSYTVRKPVYDSGMLGLGGGSPVTRAVSYPTYSNGAITWNSFTLSGGSGGMGGCGGMGRSHYGVEYEVNGDDYYEAYAYAEAKGGNGGNGGNGGKGGGKVIIFAVNIVNSGNISVSGLNGTVGGSGNYGEYVDQDTIRGTVIAVGASGGGGAGGVGGKGGVVSIIHVIGSVTVNLIDVSCGSSPDGGGTPGDTSLAWEDDIVFGPSFYYEGSTTDGIGFQLSGSLFFASMGSGDGVGGAGANGIYNSAEGGTGAQGVSGTVNTQVVG